MVIVWNSLQEDTAEISDKCDSSAILGSWKVWGMSSTIPNQEDHGFYPWVNWSSGTGCSPLVGVSREPRALPVGLHQAYQDHKIKT